MYQQPSEIVRKLINEAMYFSNQYIPKAHKIIKLAEKIAEEPMHKIKIHQIFCKIILEESRRNGRRSFFHRNLKFHEKKILSIALKNVIPLPKLKSQILLNIYIFQVLLEALFFIEKKKIERSLVKEYLLKTKKHYLGVDLKQQNQEIKILIWLQKIFYFSILEKQNCFLEENILFEITIDVTKYWKNNLTGVQKNINKLDSLLQKFLEEVVYLINSKNFKEASKILNCIEEILCEKEQNDIFKIEHFRLSQICFPYDSSREVSYKIDFFPKSHNFLQRVFFQINGYENVTSYVVVTEDDNFFTNICIDFFELLMAKDENTKATAIWNTLNGENIKEYFNILFTNNDELALCVYRCYLKYCFNTNQPNLIGDILSTIYNTKKHLCGLYDSKYKVNFWQHVCDRLFSLREFKIAFIFIDEIYKNCSETREVIFTKVILEEDLQYNISRRNEILEKLRIQDKTLFIVLMGVCSNIYIELQKENWDTTVDRYLENLVSISPELHRIFLNLFYNNLLFLNKNKTIISQEVFLKICDKMIDYLFQDEKIKEGLDILEYSRGIPPIKQTAPKYIKNPNFKELPFTNSRDKNKYQEINSNFPTKKAFRKFNRYWPSEKDIKQQTVIISFACMPGLNKVYIIPLIKESCGKTIYLKPLTNKKNLVEEKAKGFALEANKFTPQLNNNDGRWSGLKYWKTLFSLCEALKLPDIIDCLEDRDIDLAKYSLMLVPDDFLINVPLHALRFRKDKKYLIEKFRDVYYCSSLSFLSFIKACNKKNENISVTFCGVTTAWQEKVSQKKYQYLPSVIKESEIIEKKFSDITLLGENPPANTENIKKYHSLNKVFIFSGHGRTEDGALFFKKEKYATRPEVLGVEQLLQTSDWNFKGVELVILNSCTSGQLARGSRGRDILGMPGAFISCGAESVISAVCNVNDYIAPMFTEYFFEEYKRLRATEANAKSLALKKAMMRIKQHKEYKHPIFWCPWFLFGSPY